MNTSLTLKEKLWPAFVAACESQWKCGGQRYALGPDKEWTDLVCEVAGDEWILGTIVKYIGEIKNSNPRPEVDYFKIAVYAFLAWIKAQGTFTDRDRGEEFEKKTP